MLKYISKFAMDILPSLAATIIGAYVVNHYIVTKPGAEAPAVTAISSAEPKKDDVKAVTKPTETASDEANFQEPGVRAKGISEKAVLEKSAADVLAQKPVEKPLETASLPAETRRHPPAPREKTAARTITVPAAESSGAPVVAAVASPSSTPLVEAAVAPEQHHDANDLARAAIDRLRGIGESSPRAPETARVADPGRVAAAPPVAAPPISAPSVRPLPPPIMVSTPAAEPSGLVTGSIQGRHLYPDAAGPADPYPPTPPADIPSAPLLPPLVLHAEAIGPSMKEHTSVAQDMLAAARSVFHAVLPNSPSN
jgi:hypothetical protein